MLNYQILSRLLYYVPYHLPMHPGRMLSTLNGISSVVQTLNGNGIAFSANIKLSKTTQDMGKTFLKVTVIIQLVAQMGFVFLAGFFHHRCRTRGPLPKNIKNVLITLYYSSAILFVRTIYRTIECYSVPSFHITRGTNPS